VGVQAPGSTSNHARIGSADLPPSLLPTLRLEQGEELAVVSRILGHASITTAANVYGHLTDAMLGRAADRTDLILGRRTVSTA
jgi:integrase